MTQKILAAALILGTAGLWASTAVKVEPAAAHTVEATPAAVIAIPAASPPAPVAAIEPAPAGAVFVSADCANCGPARGPVRFVARRFSERRFRPLQRLFGRRR